MFIRAGSLFSSLTRRSKVAGAITAILVRQTFEEILHQQCADLPEEILVKTKAVSFKSGTLTISTPRLAAVELSMRAEGLIKGINEVLGKKAIKRLRFK